MGSFMGIFYGAFIEEIDKIHEQEYEGCFEFVLVHRTLEYGIRHRSKLTE